MTNKPLAGFALAALVSLAGVLSPVPARAQGAIDFLWGGDSEWGGGRQNVSFNKQYKPGEIIVSFGDRRAYLITSPGRAISYPIAVPREQSRWQGTTFVSSKRVNPSWTPTPDMLRENPKLPRWVPGGHPMNPLGNRALYLGSSTYRIHGTDAPWTIGQAVSKGCVRMFNEDVLDLYQRVPVGARVTVTWQRFSTQGVASYDDAPAPAAAPPPKAAKTASQPPSQSTSGPKYVYVNPFEALFGGPEPAPAQRKPTPIKKYSSTVKRPAAATTPVSGTQSTPTPPAQSSETKQGGSAEATTDKSTTSAQVATEQKSASVQ